MSAPDFELAKRYVFERLERELAPELTYHSLAHTRDDVLPAAERLAELAGLAQDEALLLRTAALYHDLGFVEAQSGHEAASARLAAETLPRFGYSPAQIGRIQALIRATELPQNPGSPLAEMLADADLDVLGRDDFLRRNHDMQREVEALGAGLAPEAWYRAQLEFLKSHRYFTPAAQALRQAGQARNIEKMEALLAGLSDAEALHAPGPPGAATFRRVLARVPLFHTLPPAEISLLAHSLRPVELDDGELLLREDRRGDSFYVVIDGQVEIVKALGSPDERHVGLRGPGEVIGEMSLFLPDGQRTASARGAGHSHLLEMTRADFDALLERQPRLAIALVQVLSARLSRSHDSAIQDLQAKNRRLSDAYQALQAAQAELIVKERLERELQVAAEIQRSILPGRLPALPGYDFGALMEPAKQVGGDFYDLIPLGPGQLAVVVGDITDKGVPAAIFMAQTHALIQAAAEPGKSPKDTLLSVNQHLLNMNRSGLFATILYGVLDAASGRFAYARAGHELPLWRGPDGQVALAEMDTGVPLGLWPEAPIDEQALDLRPGTTLLLYTDGATDALVEPGQPFGVAGLTQTLRQSADQTAQTLCERLYAALLVPGKPEWKRDDVTLVAVRRT
ncbi:MAG: SpoIIE family protein phosphatase [Anaerolineales bacterium]|nr:SpoIIE family protein phosphatase [Anaerolineales bacterium]